jgi:glycogen debranching enzyme
VRSTCGVDLDALRRVLCDLSRANCLDAIGSAGPLLASAGADSLFHCLFGRDALRMAQDLLDDFPHVARATLLELAGLQGVRTHPRAEEEPGRILHEHRPPEDPHTERLSVHWAFPYYGAVDTTPQWINLLTAYCARHGPAVLDERVTDRTGQPRSLWETLRAALGWIVGRLDDPSGGGYLWVCRAAPHGILNQVWEDSGDSHHHADGTLLDVTRPYAPVAVQGYAHDALLGASHLLEQAPRRRPGECAALRFRALRLRSRVLHEFWQPDLGTFAQALACSGTPGRWRPVRVTASSPGHLLASTLLDGDDAAPHRDRLVDRLMEADLLAGAGVRTKSTRTPRFRAGSYHNGSVWPMDTGVIADGLHRHGYRAAANELEHRLLRACATVGGFPEFFRGDEDGQVRVNTATIDAVVDGRPNRLEQPPQANQGWTATRVWRILRRRGAITRDGHLPAGQAAPPPSWSEPSGHPSVAGRQ